MISNQSSDPIVRNACIASADRLKIRTMCLVRNPWLLLCEDSIRWFVQEVY